MGWATSSYLKTYLKPQFWNARAIWKLWPYFICLYLVIVLGKWSFVFPSHLFPSATVKKLFFKVFRKPKFFPSNSAHRNVLWQKQHWQGHACQHVSWPSVGDPPPLPAWRFPACNLRTCCLFWMCETPVQILYTCLGLNMCSYALPTCFSLHRATFVETCNSGLGLAQKMKENNFIHQ